MHACVCAKSLPSCQILCDPIDCSPLGSSVHGISQARILEWVAFPSFRVSSQPRDRTYVSCIGRRFFTTSTTYIYIRVYTHTYTLHFYCGLSQNVEYSSLCCIVGPCLSILLYILVCICKSQTPNPSLPQPSFSPLATSLFSIWVCLFCR